MADEEENQTKAELPSTQEQMEALEAQSPSTTEDSIAINRTRGAYQPDSKKYTQKLKE